MPLTFEDFVKSALKKAKAALKLEPEEFKLIKYEADPSSDPNPHYKIAQNSGSDLFEYQLFFQLLFSFLKQKVDRLRPRHRRFLSTPDLGYPIREPSPRPIDGDYTTVLAEFQSFLHDKILPTLNRLDRLGNDIQHAACEEITYVHKTRGNAEWAATWAITFYDTVETVLYPFDKDSPLRSESFKLIRDTAEKFKVSGTFESRSYPMYMSDNIYRPAIAPDFCQSLKFSV